jgi:hypothetical protein
MDFSKTIIIRKKGESYTAQFSQEGDMVKVTANGRDGTIPTISTQTKGPVNAKTMARVILTEMIEDGRVKPD